MPESASIFQAGQWLQDLQDYWWPFCRLLSLLAFAPLFSHRALTRHVRVLLAIALTVVIAGSLPAMPKVNPISLQGVLLSLEQIAIGLLIGLTLQLVFAIFSVTGEVISAQLGLSMAMLNDPINGVSSASILFQVYFLLLAFLFFAIDAHLITVSIVQKSFIYWPVGSGLLYAGFNSIILGMAWVLAAAVLLALPIAFCMTLVQFCFGLLNRISPTLNLFSLGFPMAILVGLFCVYLTLPNMAEGYLHLTRELLDNLGKLMRGSHG